MKLGALIIFKMRNIFLEKSWPKYGGETKKSKLSISLDQQSERAFTREISSQDETRPGMESSMSMVKCLLLFTRFCRDEISSRDERQGWKKEKKTCKHFILGWNFKMSMFFLIFDVCILVCFPNSACLSRMKVWI